MWDTCARMWDKEEMTMYTKPASECRLDRIHVRVETDTKEALAQLAKLKGCTVSALVREIVEEHIKKAKQTAR